MNFPRREFGRFLEPAPDHVQERHDGAADEERDAPAPARGRFRRHQIGDRVAEQRGEHDRDLLACRLPGDIEALVPGRRHLRQIDRDAAEFDAGRKPLQEPPQHHQHRREHADGRVARHESDEDRAAGHDRERQDKAFAPADAVDVGPQRQRADRAHRKSRRETQEGRHQRGVRVVAREEGLRDLPGVDAEQKEVIHFEEIAAGDAQNGLDFVEPRFVHRIPPSARLLGHETEAEWKRCDYWLAQRAAARPAAAPVANAACNR